MAHQVLRSLEHFEYAIFRMGKSQGVFTGSNNRMDLLQRVEIGPLPTQWMQTRIRYRSPHGVYECFGGVAGHVWSVEEIVALVGTGR